MTMHVTPNGDIVNLDRIIWGQPSIHIISSRSIIAPETAQGVATLRVDRVVTFDYKVEMEGKKERVRLCKVALPLSALGFHLPADSKMRKEFIRNGEAFAEVDDEVKEEIIIKTKRVYKYLKEAAAATVAIAPPSASIPGAVPETVQALSTEAIKVLNSDNSGRLAAASAWLSDPSNFGETEQKIDSMAELREALDPISLNTVDQNLQSAIYKALGFSVNEQAGVGEEAQAA